MREQQCLAGLLGVIAALGGCAGANRTESLSTAGSPANPVTPTVAERPQAPVQPAAGAEKPKSDQPEGEKAKSAHKRAKLLRDLEIARQNVHKAELVLEGQRADNDASIHRAEIEQELAAAKLKKLSEKDAPLRLAESRLNLRSAEDGFKESEEELAQLEMMYKDEDLADKTREIVLNRGRRRLERARAGLMNQQTAVDNLEKHSLPLEIAELRSQFEQKAQALDSARRAAKAGVLEKEIALMSARSEVMRIEEEIADVESTPATQSDKSAK